MATDPQRHPLPRISRKLPFLGYAQLVRMLVPPVSKIGFYDAAGTALWISDGGEGPELDRHIELLLARDATRSNGGAAAYTAVEDADRIFLFTVDDNEYGRLGAVAIVCRDMASAAHGSARTIARLVTPLIEILRDAWALRTEDTRPRIQIRPPAQPSDTTTAEIAVTDSVADDNLPPLAMLRRTLAALTQGRQCSFGALLATNPAFTLSHRVSQEESDLEVTAAIDNARACLIDLLAAADGKPIIVNDVTPGRSDFSPHKVLALPLRSESESEAALLVLFRSRHERDFSRTDIDALRDMVPRFDEKLLTALTARREGASASPQAKPQTSPIANGPRRAREAVGAMELAMSMDERVRAALAEDGFSLLAQRISPLRNTERPPRFEVLLRMRDGDTTYAPAAFFAAAQTCKLMPRLDEWVIRSLFRTLREHANVVRLSGWEFCINVARQSLASPRFGDFVVAEVGKSAIPPGLLVFELSEEDALGHRACVDSLAARLREIGCRIALDNCRAGLGTFGSLRDWPVSCLKLDGCVTRDVGANAQSRSVVRALAELAAQRGIETVAECVETEEVRTTLRDIGLDFAQGFHIEVPQPIETLFR
jgi:EAL domain-containing protein (putative c-di-GMP-specific phosphodiesterase class I)